MIWDKYHEECSVLSKKLVKIIRKREFLLLIKDDDVVVETLAKELRDCIEDVIQSQDHLKSIRNSSTFLRR